MLPVQRSRVLAGLSVLALAGTAAGCGGGGNSSGGSGGGGGGGSSSGGGGQVPGLSLKIGGLLPQTGDLSVFGPPGQKAQNMAMGLIQQIAKASGGRLKVSVEYADTQTDPSASVSAARKLVGDGATCLTGAWASADTIPVGTSVAARQQIPVISPASTSAQITTLKDNGFVFRTAPSDVLQSQALAQFINKQLGGVKGKTISLAARNDAYGQGFISGVQKALQGLGAKTTGPVLYDPMAASYDSDAAKIVAGNPAAYVIIDFPETYAKVGAALLRTGKFDAHKLFTADGLAAATIPKGIPKAALVGARGTRPGTPQSGAAADAFSKLFNSSAPKNVQRATFDAQNFDGTLLCFLGAVAAKSSDGAAIAKQLKAVSGPPGKKYTFQQLPQAVQALAAGKDIDYEGASGPINFDANGDPSTATYDQYMYKSNGKLVVTGQFQASEK